MSKKLTNQQIATRERRLARAASLFAEGKDSKQVARAMRLTVPAVVGLRRTLNIRG